MSSVEEHDLDIEEASAQTDVRDAPSNPPEPAKTEDVDDGGPLSLSAFELVQRVLVGMVQAVEDGADLLGASVREELGRFRTDVIRSLVATSLLAAGGGLLTAGLALLMHAWMGSWPPVLLLLGAVYLMAGVWLFVSSNAPEDEQ